MEIVNTTFSAFTSLLLGASAEILAKYSSARLSSAFRTGKAVVFILSLPGPSVTQPFILSAMVFSAREAVVAADLVCAVRHLDAGDPHGAAFGVVRYPGVFRREHGAVYDLDGQRRGDGDVNCAVLVVHGERDRTVAVVLVSARAPSERQSARARMSAPVRLAFKCLPPFKE